MKNEVEGQGVLTEPGASRPPLFSLVPVGLSGAAPCCNAVFLRDALPLGFFAGTKTFMIQIDLW
ncbi:hypothetical protein TRIP_B330040 [uncultured Desulfatiglans sp.]|uniref:Uncharacterized protein n=1 Tax=Uncultured Desulfatiglans sp. TaxID=1748965 RepID=A0A653A768_UNCDX|nr:hypothetical protein TRIP_B330040 [uncultured Desulfatiglans sp.]